MSLDYEKNIYSDNIQYIAGTDEAGRGCLLGPVFAAAVVFPKDFQCDLINDSKKLSSKQREKAFDIIIKNAISYSIVSIDAETIDKINIYNASKKAMEMAISQLKCQVDYILTDAMKIASNVPFEPLIKGDAKALCIAAASILAKVSRDRYCIELDKKYPQYEIAKHKGYGTKRHLEILEEYGPISKIYRYSYRPVQDSLYKKFKLL